MNYVHKHYQDIRDKIINEVKGQRICLIVDEATGRNKKKILNTLVGLLNGEELKPRLFDVQYLDKTDAVSVVQAINTVINALYPLGIEYSNIQLLVSDQAPYMVSVGKRLKLIYTDMRHVTCIVHALHRVCLKIKETYTDVNMFQSNFQNLFDRASYLTTSYKEITGLTALPPDVVVTRWASWIKGIVYISENFDKIKLFIESLPTDKNIAIKSLQQLIKKDGLESNMLEVYQHKYLVDAITELETKSLSLSRQKQIIQEVRTMVKGDLKVKLESSLAKNPHLHYFLGEIPLPLSINFIFAPLVSVDVERSFSLLNMLLSDRRLNLTEENLKYHMVIQHYSNYN